MKKLNHARRAAILAAALSCLAAPSKAQPFGRYHGYSHPHSHGCFVTTSPQHHQKGIRFWRNPCPYGERWRMNPYYYGYSRPFRPHPSPN